MARILLAEDDPTLADVLRRQLEREDHAVVVVTEAHEAVEEARSHRPDLVLVDLDVPLVDGVHVGHLLRAEPDLAMIVVTARSGESGVEGLDLEDGALVTAPSTARELMARVRIVLRRHAAGPEDGRHVVGDLLVDTVRHEVWVGGRPVRCSAAEFAILECLAASPGQPFRRPALLDHALGPDHGALDRTVDVHVMNLRRKIEHDHNAPTRLLTVFGIGYKLADPVAADTAS